MIKNIVKTYFLIFIILGVSSIFAQEITENWQIIKSNDYSDIFIDPDKVVEYGNDISVWVLEKLKVVQLIDKSDEILSIKTHYLFNKMKKRYAEIGIIYYDSKGGIVNRSSKSSFNGGPSAFLTPITASAKTQIIFNSVISYLITGTISAIDSSRSKNEKDTLQSQSEKNGKNNGEYKNSDTPIKTITYEKILENDNSENENIEFGNSQIEDENIIKSQLENKTNDNFASQKTEDNEVEVIDKSEITQFEPNINENNKEKTTNLSDILIPEKEYNVANERALKNTIFTDGNLYCIQISSWKTKLYADREVNKLLKKGFDAFILSIKPKNKNGIWHRVRVGYFNSLEEVIKIQKIIKNN